MGTDKVINTKPQLPPKPQLKGGRWHRGTDVIQENNAQEALHQIQARCGSMPARTSGSQGFHGPEDENDLDSSPQMRPIPKPRLHKIPQLLHTLSQPADDNQNVSCSSSSSAKESATSTSPNTCPVSCPCACHHAGTHGADECTQHEDYHSNAPTRTDREYHSLSFSHCKITGKGKPRRVPPNIPVPARPLPKQPQQIIIRDVRTTKPPTEHEDVDGVYEDLDSEQQNYDCNLTPALTPNQLGTGTERMSAAIQFPLIKPVPALRKLHKENMVPKMQSNNLDTECVTLDSLRNGLRRILSSEKQENRGETRKPKAMKNAIVKFILSKSMAQSLSEQGKASSQKKTQTKAKETQGNTTEEATIEGKKQKSPPPLQTKPILKNMIKNLSQDSATDSIHTTKTYQQQSTAILPSTALEAHGNGNASPSVSKQKDNNFYGLLESLWQERCVVKNSGILNQLNKEEIQLQESIYEVAVSEHSYLEGLTVAVDLFQECPVLKLSLLPRDQKSLFSGISKIREISQSFMDAMMQTLESSLLCDGICDVVEQYATGPFGAYVDYIRNMPYQKQTLMNLRKENPQIVEILNKLQDDPCCNRLPLDSFLSLPFQRIPRLKILMETVLKRTAPGSDVQASAERALKAVSKVVEACNREVGKMKQMEEMVLIANKTEFECKALPLVSSSRWLVREGDLDQLSLKENIFGQKKLCPVHLFLFNDLLLVATRKGTERYIVHDHVHRSLIEVTEGNELEEDLGECDLTKVFQLVLLKNHRGAMSHYLLQASTQAERASWLEVLSRQRAEEEGVYEEWDCPQVRCIDVYHAKGAGELSLQREDIVNIIQKRADGYMEGWKLADGERGWFPAACVEEISTEHLQRRHLRERYRVLQAATHLIKRCRPPKDCRTTTCFK